MLQAHTSPQFFAYANYMNEGTFQNVISTPSPLEVMAVVAENAWLCENVVSTAMRIGLNFMSHSFRLLRDTIRGACLSIVGQSQAGQRAFPDDLICNIDPLGSS
jgi:hypothetical protein